MTGSFARGLIAGAAGTTALNAVSYLDMAARGRPASTVPEETVDALAGLVGTAVPGRGGALAARRTGWGALAGIGNGLGIGVMASLTRSAGFRLPGPLGAVVTGAAALAATDVPVTALHVSDPRRWTTTDWLADAVPHLAYGAAAQAVLSAVPTPAERLRPRRPAGAGLTLRSALLGVAAGGRSSLGPGVPALTDPRTGRAKKLSALASVTTELVLDKQPLMPARTGTATLPTRLAMGAAGAGMLAARQQANAAMPVAAGVAGAVAGSFGGQAWRRWAGNRMPDLPAALLEDAVAAAVALLACLPGRHRPARPTLVVVPAV